MKRLNKLLLRLQFDYLSIVILLTFFISSVGVAQQNPWKFVKEKEGIKVYYRTSTAGNINEVKITSHFETDARSLISAITDVVRYPDWVYGAVDSRVLKQVSAHEMIYYNKIDFPWPLSDRDIAVHSKISHNLKTGVITSVSKAEPKSTPIVDNHVRIESFNSQWAFTPAKNRGFDGEYTFSSDPGGNLPVWAINLALDEGPFKTIVNFKKLVSNERYHLN